MTEHTEKTGRTAKKRTPIWVRFTRVAGLLAAILLLMKFTGFGERMFYWPSRTGFETPPGYEDVFFESEGRTLHGWFLPAADAAPGETRPVIVHCHGNAFNISRHDVFVDFLPAAGFHVLIFDYRTYGRSERGPLRREGLVEDARAAIEYARSRDDTTRVGLYGLSLGGTIALAAAARDEGVDAVCSLATFASWRGIASHYSGPLGRWLVRDGFDSVDSVASLGDRPLLILHGTDDEIVPFENGPTIRDAALAAGIDTEFVRLDGARHVDWIDTHPAARTAIIAFFRRTLAPE